MMDGCVYEEDGKCMKYTTDIVTSYCYGNGYPCKDRAITNAMKIRAMTDEELADYFSELSCWPNAGREDCRGMANCMDCWLNWLKSPAEEGE